MRAGPKFAIAGVGFVAVVATAVPAFAAGTGTVTVSLSMATPGSGGPTLTLLDTKGNPLSALSLTSGTQAFVTKVSETNVAPANFTVEAAMSNLYGYTNGVWSCSATVPSSALSVTAPPNLLEADGLAGSVLPQLAISGDLTSILSGLLGGASGAISNLVVQGTQEALSQAQLAGNSTGSIYGTTLTNVLGDLPLKPAVGAGGAFTNPAPPPAASNCTNPGGTPTNVTYMTGLVNTTGLVNDVQGVLNALPNKTVTTLVGAGLVNEQTVLSAVFTALGINPLLVTAAQITQIENTLTATLASTPLVSSDTLLSGNYSSVPNLAVNTAGQAPGSYQGTLTVTEVDG